MKKLTGIFSGKKYCLPLINLQGFHVKKYRSFRTFLLHNHNALGILAEMEQMFYSGTPFSLDRVKVKYEELLEAVMGSVYALNTMSSGAYAGLLSKTSDLDRQIAEEFHIKREPAASEIAFFFDRITADMKNTVGAKAANLAVIKNALGFNVPEGFAVTSYAYERFMEENRLSKPVQAELCRISRESPSQIERVSARIQAMIDAASVPEYIAGEIRSAYKTLEAKTRRGVMTALRSSAVGEDSEATFAGQFATVLNVSEHNIIEAYKKVLSSKYSARAISYRIHYGLEDREIPMCAACVAMLDPKTSGVMYTVDPSSPSSGVLKINSLWGLGEYLVGGGASPDIFVVDRTEKSIISKEIKRKDFRLVNAEEGGVRIEEVPGVEKEHPSLYDNYVVELARCGLALEGFFGKPQDVEWALDKKGSLFILQSRPLAVHDEQGEELAEMLAHAPDSGENPVIFSGGKTASGGAASGIVFIVGSEEDLGAVPENAILVTKTSSPRFAQILGRMKGIITDVGSAASHLASVAREMGIPAIVDTRNATSALAHGETVTMLADTATVYRGAVTVLLRDMRHPKKIMFETPARLRTRSILGMTAPLTLMNPDSPSFTPEGCRTLHDIIRFTHEQAVREMFDITEKADGVRSIKLTATIPLELYLIDLGGGLSIGLTTCDTVTPGHIESIPMRSVWKGFTHPGISWEGTVNFSAGSFMTLFASTATSEFGEAPGGRSYAILSKDYMNLSVKFGYHFATVDSLCGEDSSQNYISLQFAGGAGNYYSRTLRVHFLARVLGKLGFNTSINGDLINAFAGGYGPAAIENMLDYTGRLLASSRLLDMVISGREDIEHSVEAFFRGEYDFLSERRKDRLEGFYTHGGYWKRIIENNHAICMQDGSKSGYTISSEVAAVMGKVVGSALQDFLDNIEAYYYFPLAIARDSEISDGAVSVRIKPAGGHIDRAGGIAFGIKNTSNYFALRINALENNLALFEYVNNRRFERASIRKKVETGKWQSLRVAIKGHSVKGFLNNELMMEYAASKPPEGFVGLWTKADSVTYFDELVIESDGRKYTVEL